MSRINTNLLDEICNPTTVEPQQRRVPEVKPTTKKNKKRKDGVEYKKISTEIEYGEYEKLMLIIVQKRMSVTEYLWKALNDKMQEDIASGIIDKYKH